mgnify:CR=1 FL=1
MRVFIGPFERAVTSMGIDRHHTKGRREYHQGMRKLMPVFLPIA